MIAITYGQMLLAVTAIWFAVRAVVWMRNKRVDLRREAALMLVYICLVVVVRFTFCPFGKVDGRIQPLLFDAARIVPFWLNIEPLVHLFDYPTKREILLNLIGNIAMFIPLGIVWPAVFPKLNTHGRVLAAGFGVSLCIELLQLPFFGRASDVDDLILNTVGFAIGYGVFRLAECVRKRWVAKSVK